MVENESQITSDLQLAINELEKVLNLKIELEEKIKLANNENYNLSNTIEEIKNENDNQE